MRNLYSPTTFRLILQQAAGDGILNGYDAQQGVVVRHAVEHLGEGGAGDGLNILLAEIGSCGGFVITTGYALYGNSFLHRSKIKNPVRAMNGILLNMCYCLVLHHVYLHKTPFLFWSKIKIKVKVICKIKILHCSSVVSFVLQM